MKRRAKVLGVGGKVIKRPSMRSPNAPARKFSGGRLSSAERRALPTSAFAIPERRAYPIEDPGHARNALSRVSQFGSSSEKRRVRAAVHRRYPSIGGRK